MSLRFNILNFKNHASIWNKLKKNLSKIFEKDIQIVFPEEWNIKFYKWFQNVEEIAFREELRYSYKEVEERLNHMNILLLFILVNNNPEALLLGYLLPNELNKTFFLDTIATKHQGKGIGTIILKNIIKWLKREKYKFVWVETEEVDEKKIMLQKFY
ncbi:MAG: GNAT family N-acetyltransferase [Candidatus Thorarchaeota archaeon]